MFGKEKKPKKPKSKARKIIDWIITGVFAALLVGVGVIQIINKTNKLQNILKNLTFPNLMFMELIMNQ